MTENSSVREFRFNFFNESREDKSSIEEDHQVSPRASRECKINGISAMVGEYMTRPEAQHRNYGLREGLRTILNENSSLPELDIVSGEYEGGYKLWEGGADLVRFLLGNKELVSGKKVLEIGCGHALPGICAILTGAENVDFQDYNEEVLMDVTIPNIVENVGIERIDMLTDKISLISGSWGSINASQLLVAQYDVILASEILYDVEYYDSLHTLFNRALGPTSTALIASKLAYFGLEKDAGADEFRRYVETKGAFQLREEMRIDDGKSNIRGIYALTRT